MARKYRIPIKSDGELDFSDVTINPGETYSIFVYPGEGDEMVHECVVRSELEDEKKQVWIAAMIAKNVSSVMNTPEGKVYPLLDLAEFVQRRLIDHDPTYPCHEIPFPEAEDED